MKKLSIITPYYNTLSYTRKLASALLPQLNEQVEWIIIDDGTHEKELDTFNVRVIHLEKNSGNASFPRNVGIDNALGQYITFVDSDDIVYPNYVERILKKIAEEEFDYCYFGWKSGNNDYYILDEPLEWNKCVWNCVYKKSTIGNNRFNPNINIGEDADFNERVRIGKRKNINEILYYYNWNVRDDNLSSLYRDGKISYKKEE